MTPFILSQIFIGIAFVSDIASFQFKKRETTLVLLAISATLISIHFFLLGAVTAGVIVAINAIRFSVSIFTTNQYLKWLFLGAVLLAGWITYDSFVDILSLGTGIFGTLASFNESEKKLRVFMMLASFCIITHNVIIMTPIGIFVEVFFLGSNLVSYWRFYMQKGRS